jgi:hypothetical protein
VFNTAAVLGNLSKQKEHAHLGNKCPSCTFEKETTGHILSCPEIGRQKNLNRMLRSIQDWLHQAGTQPPLTLLLSQFLFSRGTMIRGGEVLHTPDLYEEVLTSLQLIGWRRIMEGMVPKVLLELAPDKLLTEESPHSPTSWTQAFITKLLEATHGQWIYRNLMIHDKISGLIANKTKEQLHVEIERQIDLGGEGLEEEDKWMMEVNMGDLEESTGIHEHYWLIAIRTARESIRLRNRSQ